MIKSKELMIGNWVIAKDQDGNKCTDYVMMIHHAGLVSTRLGCSALEPIPLTEEWLLTFGFNLGCTDWMNNGFIIYQYGDNFVFEYREGVKVKYVHQLQNLYFALTGEELTIKTNEK